MRELIQKSDIRMASGSQIALYSLAAVLAAGGCYAVYFDHKRRSDPEFRHRISEIVVMYWSC